MGWYRIRETHRPGWFVYPTTIAWTGIAVRHWYWLLGCRWRNTTIQCSLIMPKGRYLYCSRAMARGADVPRRFFSNLPALDTTWYLLSNFPQSVIRSWWVTYNVIDSTESVMYKYIRVTVIWPCWMSKCMCRVLLLSTHREQHFLNGELSSIHR